MPPSAEIRASELRRIAGWLKLAHAPGCEHRECAAVRKWLRELAEYECDYTESESVIDRTACVSAEPCPPCLAKNLILAGRA